MKSPLPLGLRIALNIPGGVPMLKQFEYIRHDLLSPLYAVFGYHRLIDFEPSTPCVDHLLKAGVRAIKKSEYEKLYTRAAA
jgi:hypothetical protein